VVQLTIFGHRRVTKIYDARAMQATWTPSLASDGHMSEYATCQASIRIILRSELEFGHDSHATY
jgi:hypothetical protein